MQTRFVPWIWPVTGWRLQIFLSASVTSLATGAGGVTAVAAVPSDAINKTLNKAAIIGFP